MGIPFAQIDAFAERAFSGNPAAVCLLDRPGDAAWMQAVAGEMNLSETAFLVPRADGYDLRWFTPSVEVDLCGHATLASAHFLWETGHLASDRQARFHTRSGWLTASRRGDWIELDFPATPPEAMEAQSALPGALQAALHAAPVFSGKSRYDLLAQLSSEEEVRRLRPDLKAIAALPARGVIVTARSTTAPYDFVARFFAPASGIDEDPVTGSAHCCLGPFWQQRLGKSEFLAYQASQRGGVVRVRVDGERVVLGGKAVTIVRGELVGV